MDSGSYRVSVPSDGECKIVGITANGGSDGAFGSARCRDASRGGRSQGHLQCHRFGLRGPLARRRKFEEPWVRGASAGARRGRSRLQRRCGDREAHDRGHFDRHCARWQVAGCGFGTARRVDHAPAGRGRPRCRIRRLRPDLDRPQIESLRRMPIVRDMLVREDGSVIAVGGAMNYDRPFVVRLLGEGGGTSRGVIGFSRRACRAGGSGRQGHPPGAAFRRPRRCRERHVPNRGI